MKQSIKFNLVVLGLIVSYACACPVPGPKGDTGAVGATGAMGATGANGQDAEPVETVKFCHADTVYPSSFPEYGLCIHNELYAVYWDGHNSWLAKVVNGHYMSTTTGLQCTFTVSANCTVVEDTQ